MHFWINKQKNILETVVLLSSNSCINQKARVKKNYKIKVKLLQKYQNVKQISLIGILSLYVYEKYSTKY